MVGLGVNLFTLNLQPGCLRELFGIPGFRFQGSMLKFLSTADLQPEDPFSLSSGVPLGSRLSKNKNEVNNATVTCSLHPQAQSSRGCIRSLKDRHLLGLQTGLEPSSESRVPAALPKCCRVSVPPARRTRCCSPLHRQLSEVTCVRPGTHPQVHACIYIIYAHTTHLVENEGC